MYNSPYLFTGANGTSYEIELLANKQKKAVHGNNLKRFSIDYEFDEHPE